MASLRSYRATGAHRPESPGNLRRLLAAIVTADQTVRLVAWLGDALPRPFVSLSEHRAQLCCRTHALSVKQQRQLRGSEIELVVEDDLAKLPRRERLVLVKKSARV